MISVVIPTYCRYKQLECIFSFLHQQSLMPDEIVVVDQTPFCKRPDGFYDRFSFLPFKLINLDSPSLSASRNLGAQKAAGDVLLFLDDDMEFGPDLVQNHRDVMERESVDAVYGAISTGPQLPESCERVTRRLDPISWFLKSPNKKWDGMVLVLSGANTMIKRDVFLKAGGFDENLPRMEDIELGYRLFRSGAKLHYSSVPHVVHNAAPEGGTRATQKDMQYIRLLSRVYLYRKHFDGWAVQQFYLLVLINGFMYRDLLSGAFYLSHLRQPFWPLRAVLMLCRAHRQAESLLKR